MLSEYQLKIAHLYNIPIGFAHLYNIPIGYVKKLVPNFFDKGKYALHYVLQYVLKTLLQTRIKTKMLHRVVEFNQSQWLKPYIEFSTQKRIEPEKNGDKIETSCTY